MKTSNQLALALALVLGASAAAGCGPGDPSKSGDDDGSNGGGDDGGGGTQGRALDPTGTYTVHSTFDIASNVPGTAGTVVNDIIDATDGPNDPSQWILDQVVALLPNNVSFLASAIADLGAGFLNDQLLSIAPDFVTTMVQVGKDFGDVTKNFGLIETLDVTGASGTYTATHTVTGVHFKIGTVESDYLLSNYNMPNIVVDNVGITMDQTGALTIAAHTLPLTYGKVLRLGLDGAIIPAIDSNAHNLNDLLVDLVDCQALGDGLASATGLPFGSAFASACTAGLDAAANLIYTEIGNIDGTALQFQLSGTVKGTDTNGDGSIDTLASGSWTGMLSYGNTPSPLSPSKFSGTRN